MKHSSNAREQIKTAYDRDGYVAIKSFLNPLEVQEARERISQLIEQRVPFMPFNHVQYEDKSRPETLKQLQDLANADPYFGRMYFSDKFVGLAELLIGGPVRGGNFQWFNKPPRIGQPTPPHQDGYYWMLEPNVGCTMWLALDHVDEENGCVRYIPGSHKRGMREHSRTQTIGFSQGISDYSDADRAAEAPILAEPGDILVHQALTVHRANNNNSERTRMALGLIYFAHNAREDSVRKQAYQKKLTSDLVAAGKL